MSFKQRFIGSKVCEIPVCKVLGTDDIKVRENYRVDHGKTLACESKQSLDERKLLADSHNILW